MKFSDSFSFRFSTSPLSRAIARGTNLLLWCILISMLLTLIGLSFYAYPYYDDYLLQISTTKKPYFSYMVDWYTGWRGLYSAGTFQWVYFNLSARFGDLFSFYKLAPILIIFSFVGASVHMFESIRRRFFPKLNARFLGVGFAVIFLSQMLSPFESIYWLTSSLAYTTGLVFSLLLISLLLRISDADSKTRFLVKAICSSVLVGLIVGSSELLVAALISVLFIGLYFLVKQRNRIARLWKLLSLVALVCGVIVLSAPGNDVRASKYSSNHQISFSIKKAAIKTVKDVIQWSTNPVILGATFLILSTIPRTKTRLMKLRIRHLAGACLGSVWIVFICWFLVYWAIGMATSVRLSNIVFFVYLICWFALTLLISVRRSECLNEFPVLRSFVLTNSSKIILTLTLLFFGEGSLRQTVQELLITAPQFQKEIERRHNIIDSAIRNGDDYLVIPRLRNFPSTIYPPHADLRDHADSPPNLAQARFWGVDSIRTQ